MKFGTLPYRVAKPYADPGLPPHSSVGHAPETRFSDNEMILIWNRGEAWIGGVSIDK